jgi:hypothetical protein
VGGLYICNACKDENGQKTPQSFSTFTFEYKKEAKTVKPDTKTNANLRNMENFETNQFERNYVEHGRYTKIQYGIQIHNA